MCCNSPTPAELNQLLIRTDLRGLTQAQLCRRIQRDRVLRGQIALFTQKMLLAKEQFGRFLRTCPFRPPWNTGTTLNLSTAALAQYHDYFVRTFTGFAYMIHTALRYAQRESIRLKYLQQGKQFGGSFQCP
jgi:hypothetical protein